MSFFLGRLFRGQQQQQQKGSSAAAHRRSSNGCEQQPRASSSSDSDSSGSSCDEVQCPGPLSDPVEVGRRRGGLDGDCAVPTARNFRRSRTYEPHASRTSSCSAASEPFGPDDVLRAAYRKLAKRHRGRNANVLSAVDRHSGRPVTVKAFARAQTTGLRLEKMQRELAALSSVASANCSALVKLVQVLEDADYYYTVLESVPGCTLIELMANSGGHLDEQRCAAEVATPLLAALAAVHRLGTVHRDVKPEHILCSYGSIKLVDFTESAQHANLNHKAGQLEYMAPEVLDKPALEDVFHKVLYNGMSEEELPRYDEKCDVWSAGVVLLETLTGVQPFMAEDEAQLSALQARLLADVGDGGIPRFLQQKLSPLAQQFFAAVFCLDPAARPSAEALLQHPWIQRHAHKPVSSFLMPATNLSRTLQHDSAAAKRSQEAKTQRSVSMPGDGFALQ